MISSTQVNIKYQKNQEFSLFLSYICKMTKDLDNQGLKSIAKQYDLFFVDLWGVVHDGIELFQHSINALEEISNLGKEYVLLTNAPRPNSDVRSFLSKMGLKAEISSNVYTSGEAALNYLTKNYKDKKFYHIGPPRDFGLLNAFEKNKLNNIGASDFLLCTGLFDDFDKDLLYYQDLFKDYINKTMVCTNPDLIVDRGELREYCAGSVAKVFEDMGGKVEYFGKPYSKVYNQATKISNKKVLCVGDNLNTDIKGANLQNFDSLLISKGIHRQEIQNKNKENLFKKYKVKVDFIQSNLKW